MFRFEAPRLASSGSWVITADAKRAASAFLSFSGRVGQKIMGGGGRVHDDSGKKQNCGTWCIRSRSRPFSSNPIRKATEDSAHPTETIHLLITLCASACCLFEAANRTLAHWSFGAGAPCSGAAPTVLIHLQTTTAMQGEQLAHPNIRFLRRRAGVAIGQKTNVMCAAAGQAQNDEPSTASHSTRSSSREPVRSRTRPQFYR